MFPVAGLLKQLRAGDVRRPDVLVAVAGLHLAHEALHLVAHDLAVRQEERDALSTFGEAYAAYAVQVPAFIPRWRRNPSTLRS